jgi:hypothetical protein
MTADRAVSEAAGVAVLILATILVTASVGVGVLFFQGEESTEAAFSYEFSGAGGTLLVTHEGGDPVPAGELIVSGPAGNVTWAALAGSNATAPVEPGDRVLLSGGSSYGSAVAATDVIRVVRRTNGTATVFKSCQADCAGGPGGESGGGG